MNKIFTLLLTLLAFNCSLKAATIDWGELTPGTAYQMTDIGYYQGWFTATESGTITAHCTSSDIPRPFADADFSVPIEGNYYLQNGANYDFAVTAGTTYYFSAFVLNPGTFSFNYAASATLQLISATPEAGTVFNAGQHSGVTLAFSRPIAVGGASIIVGGEEKAVAANVLETYATAEIRDALMAFYDKGTLREGDNFTFRLTGVHAAGDEANVYGTDGTVEVVYVAGTRPVTLTATEGIEGASFLSYWRKADERGIIKLRFSGALQPIDTPQREAETTCELSFGAPDAGEGEVYRETIHYALSAENEITIDLRNRLRRPIDMVTSGKDYGTMSLKIMGVRDASGQYAYTNAIGSLGSFAYAMPYREVKLSLAAEFTPAPGASLTGATEVELWVTDYAALAFSGILLSYTDGEGTHTALLTDYTATPDENFDGACALTFTIPAELAAQPNLSVSLAELETADGLDHAAELAATYNTVPSGISTLPAADETHRAAAPVYDLTGRRHASSAALPRGIYIGSDGKKIFVY